MTTGRGFGGGFVEDGASVSVVLSSVLDNETAGGFTAGNNDLVFASGNENDPDGWKQVDNKTFKVPAGKAGRYLLVCNCSGEQADANSTLIVEIKVGGAVVGSGNDDRDNAAASRYVSVTALVDLVVGDDVTVTYYMTDVMGTTHVQRFAIQQLAQIVLT